MTVDNRVSVGGLTFHDGTEPYIDPAGCQWILQGISGWLDGGSDVRGSSTPYELADGDDDGDVYFGGRTVTLDGAVLAPSRPALQVAMEQVGSLLKGTQGARSSTLTVEERVRGLSRRLAVRLGGKSMVERQTANAAIWSLNLYGRRPELLSDILHTGQTARYAPGGGRTYNRLGNRAYAGAGASGIIECSNAGNIDTWPVLRIDGPSLNPLVRLVGGASMQVILPVNAGEQLVIDTRENVITVGGAERSNFLAFGSEWFSLPPGDSQVYFTADSGTGNLTVEWRDAWS